MIAALVAAEPQHVAAIAARARQADIDELWAQARATPAHCMTVGLQLATLAYTALLDDVPVAMLGVTPASTGEGTPWMVTTTDLDHLPAQKALLRLSPPVIAEFLTLYPLLFNEVDNRNVRAKRWLAWLGFTLGDPEPTGCDGELFCPFFRSAP